MPSPAGSAPSAKAQKLEPGEGERTELEVPARLGGYEITRELGRGGMGSVFLARQASLDRLVALKVMNPRWASDPIFLARFTREAFAAAQLVHHNVVQIYDIGKDGDTHFFSMEYVEGTSLGKLLRDRGSLEPAEAVGYILQAARGLKFAHDRGMVHRDVKPDNLLLNAQGVVKVADLGLVKVPAMSPGDDAGPVKSATALAGLRSLPTDMTNAAKAMGSAAYMSPEQCRNASNVDHRADIYSLGCTLFFLLTGRLPFLGANALEVMCQHVSDPPPSLESIVRTTPREISALVLKMLAKAPEDRLPDMAAVIRTLERWLGGGKGELFTPNDEHLAVLETAARRFNSAPAAGLRLPLKLGFFGLAGLALLIFLFMGRLQLAAGFLSLLVAAPAAHVVLTGLTRSTYLFSKARQVVVGSRPYDWVVAAVGGACFVGVLYLLGLLGPVLGFALAGVGLAFIYYVLVDRALALQRAGPVAECECLLKTLRLHGAPEDKVRSFVAQFSGRRWEEFFEELFGYRAKVAMRAEVAPEDDAQRERFGRWREPIVDWLEGVLAERRAPQEQRHLRELEIRRLEAQGVERCAAEARAAAEAERMVAQAARIEKSGHGAFSVREMLDEEHQASGAQRRAGYPLKPLLEFILGPQMRFLLAALLITGSAFWIRQNLRALETDRGPADVEQKVTSAVEAFFDPDPPWQKLRSPVLPAAVTNRFDHANPLVAGLLLLATLSFRGLAVPSFLMAGVAVMLFAHHLGFPEMGPVRPYQGGMAFGVLVAMLGFLVARYGQ